MLFDNRKALWNMREITSATILTQEGCMALASFDVCGTEVPLPNFMGKKFLK
jgi:hypothetical protein